MCCWNTERVCCHARRALEYNTCVLLCWMCCYNMTHVCIRVGHASGTRHTCCCGEYAAGTRHMCVAVFQSFFIYTVKESAARGQNDVRACSVEESGRAK